jgi:hypothetical protein
LRQDIKDHARWFEDIAKRLPADAPQAESEAAQWTLFFIRHNPGLHNALHPDWRYSVVTICLLDGGIGGAGFFPTADKARDVIQAAYKTPLRECDEGTYRAARLLCQHEREAVAG